MLPKKLFLIMIGVYQVCFSIEVETVVSWSCFTFGTLSVPLCWCFLLRQNKNVDSLDGYTAFRKKHKNEYHSLPEIIKGLGKMPVDESLWWVRTLFDRELSSVEKVHTIFDLLQEQDVKKIKTKLEEISVIRDLFVQVEIVQREKNNERPENNNILYLQEKCEAFYKTYKKWLDTLQNCGAFSWDEFFKKKLLPVKCLLNLMKYFQNELTIDKTQEEWLRYREILLTILLFYCEDCEKNGRSLCHAGRGIVFFFKKIVNKKTEWLSEQKINETEKANIEKMTLTDWVWYLQYQKLCKSSEKNYVIGYFFLSVVVMDVGLGALYSLLYSFQRKNLTKEYLLLWIRECGALNFVYSLLFLFLYKYELIFFKNGSRKLFLDMQEEADKEMEEEGMKELNKNI